MQTNAPFGCAQELLTRLPHPCSAMLWSLLAAAPVAAQIPEPVPPPAGKVHVGIVERFLPRDSSAVFHLTLVTERDWPCLGFEIATTTERAGATLRVALDSVYHGRTLCQPMFDPATGAAIFTAPAGPLTILLRAGRTTDTLQLFVSEDSLVLVPRSRQFIIPEVRPRWRWPGGGVEFVCTTGGPDQSLCQSIHRWLLRVPGVSSVQFPAHGLHPDLPTPAYGINQVWYYRMASPAALATIRTCLDGLAAQLRETTGVGMSVRPWMGDQIEVTSGRQGNPLASAPSRIEGVAGCG